MLFRKTYALMHAGHASSGHRSLRARVRLFAKSNKEGRVIKWKHSETFTDEESNLPLAERLVNERMPIIAISDQLFECIS